MEEYKINKKKQEFAESEWTYRFHQLNLQLSENIDNLEIQFKLYYLIGKFTEKSEEIVIDIVNNLVEFTNNRIYNPSLNIYNENNELIELHYDIENPKIFVKLSWIKYIQKDSFQKIDVKRVKILNFGYLYFNFQHNIKLEFLSYKTLFEAIKKLNQTEKIHLEVPLSCIVDYKVKI